DVDGIPCGRHVALGRFDLDVAIACAFDFEGQPGKVEADDVARFRVAKMRSESLRPRRSMNSEYEHRDGCRSTSDEHQKHWDCQPLLLPSRSAIKVMDQLLRRAATVGIPVGQSRDDRVK